MSDRAKVNDKVSRKAFDSYLNQLDEYSQSGMNDLEGVAGEIAEKAKAQGIPMESDPKILKAMIGNDLRETVPPQLYSLIAGFTDMIRELEDEGHEHKQNQPGSRSVKVDGR